MKLTKLRQAGLCLLLALSLAPLSVCAQSPNCVNIFYDRGPDASYWMGRTYSIFLQNLLGHFPQFQQMVSPIELYKKGDIENCSATFYIGSYFDNKIPGDFLADYKAASKPVVWMGYSIWQLKESLEAIFGFQYSALTTLNTALTDEKGMPTYYKWIDYKGETFFKYGDWSATEPTKFLAPFEQTIITETKPGISMVLAWARHNGTGKRIPYAIRNQNHYFVADIPFSFMHEADRYLIFSDLLFDVLGVAPTHTQRLAVVRVEDVHALSPLSFLYSVANALQATGVKENISLIPIFYDPLDRFDSLQDDKYVPMDRRVEFLQYLKEQKENGAGLIWHGVTHQYKNLKNPHDAVSGSDFEFWDAVKNLPVKEDSASWVLNRLYDGAYAYDAAKTEIPYVWLTPHYQASAIDYIVFGKVFPWNMGRVIYFNHYASGLPAIENESELWIRSADAGAAAKREQYFKNLKVELTFERWNGQFFPYEIYGDVYGQRLLPENLGNSQPYESQHVVKTRTAEDIVAAAKRNLVIRDAWASFFYHPFLLQPYESGGRGVYPGDPSELSWILKEIQKLGYQFVSAHEFAKANVKQIRSEPIYREREK